MPPRNISDVRKSLITSGKLYEEFISVPDLSVGLYRLPAGAEDPQGPHNEDEIYHVVAGRAHIRIGDAQHPVQPGDVIYVEKNVEHRFFDITEDLELLVFFAPAET